MTTTLRSGMKDGDSRDAAKNASDRGCLKERKRIIVIDDEPKIRVLFTHVLTKAGYEAIGFGDNIKAIQYLKDSGHPVDLLLLDLDMPHIDGHYFCKMARTRYPGAKIIIASNYALDVQRYLIGDADGYFEKSDGIQALKQKVKMALSYREQKN